MWATSPTIVLFMFALLSVVYSVTLNVTVGENDKDDYNPPYLTGVKSGDVIRFSFVSRIPHSVTSSTFDQPCVIKSGGVDSGVLKNTSSPSEWSLTITNVSQPLWYYCTVGTHCSGFGMVFAINPTSNQTFDAFQAKAVGRSVVSSSGGGRSTSTSSRSTSTPPSGSTPPLSLTTASKSSTAAPSATDTTSISSGDIKNLIPATAVGFACAAFVVGLSF